MAVLEVKTRKLELNEDGFLADPNEWDEDVAQSFAANEGIVLTEEHWKIIKYVRNYWEQFGKEPMIRKLCKETGVSLERLMELFPPGPLKTLCKISGLPKPKGCI